MRSNVEAAAWVLCSVVRASHQSNFVSVRDIVAAADSLNHAIISFDQLEQGVALLMRVGYVSCSADGRYALTSHAKAFVLGSSEVGEEFLAVWARFSAHLSVLCESSVGEGVRYTKSISRAEYDQAVASYSVSIAHSLWDVRP